jgi:hypothetical protein
VTTPAPATQATTISPSIESLPYIGELIRDLARNLALVEAMLDTRTRGLGFLTDEGRRALDVLTRVERQAARDNERLGFPAPSGNIPAPAALSPLQVLAEAAVDLQKLAHRAHVALEAAGVCPIAGGLPDTASLSDLVLHLGRLLEATTSRRIHDQATRDLEHLVEISNRVVDGNDRVLLTANCPHCDRRTLVVTFATGVIRCDADPKTGNYAPCTCPDSYCACHTKPVTHRHTWHRANLTGPHSWWALSDRLHLTRLTSKEPTR